MKSITVPLAVAFFTTLAFAQDPISTTGGSTVRGSGSGTSAPASEDVVPPGAPPPVPPTAVGGLTNASTTATGTGRVTAVSQPAVPASANTGLSLISGNANTTLTNGNGGALVNANAVINANAVVNANTAVNANAGLVIPPAAPVTPVAPVPPAAPGVPTTARPGVQPVNTGTGNGPGLPAGGIAPSGPRIEPAMTTSGSAGVVPSGPRVETLPQTGAPTTIAPTR